jgi:hypothetical protein
LKDLATEVEVAMPSPNARHQFQFRNQELQRSILPIAMVVLNFLYLPQEPEKLNKSMKGP